MQASANQYPEAELFAIIHILHLRYRSKIIGHIPKIRKQKKCVYIHEIYRGGFRGERRGSAPPFCCNHLFFCNHFEKPQTMLIEAKLIINNVPLIYVYSNTIKTYLTPNHFLFGR